MKIAYVHTGLWPSDSPSTTFATYNCVGLSENFEICHFFVKKNSEKSSDQILKDTFGIRKPENLNVITVKKPFFNTNTFYYRNIYKILSGYAKEKQLDAVITRNVTFLPYLIRLKNKFGLKVFFESHDFFADLSLRDDIDISKKRKQERIENRYIPYLSGLICLQRSQADLYKKKFPGLNAEVFRTGIIRYHESDENREYITYVGSLDPLKGIETLIKALQYSKAKPELLIIGGKNNAEIEKIKKFADDSGMKSKVNITGWINKHELDKYLKKTLIGILPTKDTFFNRYLTSPLKLFDYYSYGIPVIASGLPANMELIEENRTGLFFEAENPEELAQKIDQLISKKDEIRRMSEYIYMNTGQLLWKNRGKLLFDWIVKI
ncbi:MAG: glycosyltransferase [Candidatus Delongbacteria bacterium]